MFFHSTRILTNLVLSVNVYNWNLDVDQILINFKNVLSTIFPWLPLFHLGGVLPQSNTLLNVFSGTSQLAFFWWHRCLSVHLNHFLTDPKRNFKSGSFSLLIYLGVSVLVAILFGIGICKQINVCFLLAHQLTFVF